MSVLFESKERIDLVRSKLSEDMYQYLERSGTEYARVAREVINEWLSYYPLNKCNQLISRFKAGDRLFYSALWELYLYNAYRLSGFELDVEPDIAGTSYKPDFFVAKDGNHFYLEATTTGESKLRSGSLSRLEKFFDELSSRFIPGWQLEANCTYVGEAALNTKDVVYKITKWLGRIDRLSADYQDIGDFGNSHLPPLLYDKDGWSLEFAAIANKDSNTNHPLLISRGYPMGFVQTSKMVDALNEKRTKYKELDAPLVIAVLIREEYVADPEQIRFALYGNFGKRFTSGLQNDIRGYWYEQRKEKHQDVAAIITVSRIYPLALDSPNPILWMNNSYTAADLYSTSLFLRADVSSVATQYTSSLGAHDYFGITSEEK